MNIFQWGETEGLFDAFSECRRMEYEHRMRIKSLTNE